MKLRPFVNALSANYAIEPTYALHMAAVAHLVYTGKLSFDADLFETKANTYYVEEYKTNSGQSGRLSIIEMEGPLFRDDQFCGPMGMVSIAEHIKKFDADENIDAHIIKMHTPGGQVSGTEILANVIANTQKPVVVWGEDILSAGVYIASGASSIVLSGKNARVGSIGIQASYRSFKGLFEKMGVEDITIKATTSPDKNAYDLDNLSEEDKHNFAVEYLDPLDSHFMDHVKAHRVDVPDSALTGKVYFAEQAIQMGLADHIGTFEEAKQLALDMAGKPDSKMQKNKETATEQQADLQAQLETAEGRVEVLEEMVSAKDKAIATHLETIDNLNAQVKVLKSENEALSMEASRLGKLPAVDPEAETTSPEADASTKFEKNNPIGEPVPSAVAEALARGKSRKAREIAKSKNVE